MCDVQSQLLALRQMERGPTDRAISAAEYYAQHHMGPVRLYARDDRGITVECPGMDDLICHASGHTTPVDGEFDD